MKNKLLGLAIIVLVMIFALNVAFSCSAARYYTYAVNEDFAQSTAFLTPGDVDGNGHIAGNDLVTLRNILLGKGESAYADVTGDDNTDIKDFVRAKFNALDTFDFVSGGSMNLNGSSAYGGEFITRLNPGASYRLTCRYSSTSAVKVKINGVGDAKVYTLDSTSGAVTTVTKNFTTPKTLNDPEGINLQIIGRATVDSFKIEQLNTDNEYNVGS